MFLGDHQILSGAARDGVYAVNLKLIAQGNWRNVGVIDYQIGIKKGENSKQKKNANGQKHVKINQKHFFAQFSKFSNSIDG